MSSKTLLLVRHAHRDTFDRDSDNGLSGRGWEQSARLTEDYRERYLPIAPDDVLVCSSSRRRCVETVTGIARLHGRDVERLSWLMEQEPHESDTRLLERIQDFAEWWKTTAPPWVVACSHGDWLPICLNQLLGRSIDLEKGALAELRLEPGSLAGHAIELVRLTQRF